MKIGVDPRFKIARARDFSVFLWLKDLYKKNVGDIKRIAIDII
jgi:hypothetical protein